MQGSRRFSSIMPCALSCVMLGISNSTLVFSFVSPEDEPVLQQFYGLGAAKFPTFDFGSGVMLKLGDDGSADSFFDNDSSLCMFEFF